MLGSGRCRKIPHRTVQRATCGACTRLRNPPVLHECVEFFLQQPARRVVGGRGVVGGTEEQRVKPRRGQIVHDVPAFGALVLIPWGSDSTTLLRWWIFRADTIHHVMYHTIGKLAPWQNPLLPHRQD